MNLSQAKAVIGSIGFPSKMPGTSYGLPARDCLAGARLAKLPGSICSLCYALGGRASYQMPRALKGQERRLQSITDPRWVDAMVTMLCHLHGKSAIKVDLGIVGVRAQRATGDRSARYRWNEPGFHRWHDSGDLQSLEHLEKIIEVCRRTPKIRHWLATREVAFVRALSSPPPRNLVIRISATLVDGPAPRGWPLTSTVHSRAPADDAHECPAPSQGHQCGSCRACWSRDVPLVSYRLH